MFHRRAPNLVLWSPLWSVSLTGNIFGEVSHLLKKRDCLCLGFAHVTTHMLSEVYNAGIFKDSLFSADFSSLGQ